MTIAIPAQRASLQETAPCGTPASSDSRQVTPLDSSGPAGRGTPSATHGTAGPEDTIELQRDLDGIYCLLEQNVISDEQAWEMAARARAATRPATPSQAPQASLPPVPLRRLRLLSDDQRWQVLLFLSGAVPGEVERAIAASLTPRSTAGLAW